MSRKNPRLKAAHTLDELTPEQVIEFEKCATDPIYFMCNYVFIKHPMLGQILFDMYGYQKDLVKLYRENRYSIVLSARQTGKTETTCAYLLWFAIFHFEKMIVVASNKSSNAMEIIGKIRYAYEELPNWLKPGINEDSWNKHELAFENQSRIVSQTTSSDTGRGLAISLLYCDELAFVKNHIQFEFWDSIYPTLSCLKGNTLVLTDNGYKRIEEMFQPNDIIGELYDFNEEDKLYTHIGLCEPSNKYISPASSTLKLTTTTGRLIELTPHHPLMTLTQDGGELRRSDSLSVGDFVRVDYNMNCFGNISPPKDEAYMVGGYIAEGWITKNNVIWVSNIDDEFRQPYINNGFLVDKSNSHKLRKGSNEYVKYLINIGIDPDKKCYDKIIPSSVLMYDEESTYEFLGGLFDGDGSVTDRGINYTSTSHQLILEIQTVLNNIGISSRIYLNDSEKIFDREQKSGRILPHGKPLQSLRDSWGLNIPLSQMQICQQKIKFRISRKKQKLIKLIKLRKQDDWKQFHIPVSPIKPLLERLLKESGKTKKWFRVNGVRFDKCLDKKTNRRLTQQLLGKILKIVHHRQLPVSNYICNVLNRLHNPNVCWEEIKTIKESYCDRTYDFTVPESSTFLQNGIMGSNTGGSCIISSTPNGSVDLFSKLWHQYEAGKGEFNGIYVPWDAPPNRDEEFKQNKIDTLGLRKWKQEYECVFLSSDGTLIDSEFIKEYEKRLDDLEIAFELEGVAFWKQIHPEKTYIVGCDPATGDGEDFSVIQVFEFPSMEQVMEFRDNTISSNFLYQKVKSIVNFFHRHTAEVYWSFEKNGIGEGLVALYENDEYPPDATLVSEPLKNRVGLTTSNASKVKSCFKFKDMLEAGQITINSEVFIREIKSFTRQAQTYKAQTGATDDCISAFIVILRILDEMAEYDDNVYMKLYGFQDEKKWEPDENCIDENPLPFVL